MPSEHGRVIAAVGSYTRLEQDQTSQYSSMDGGKAHEVPTWELQLMDAGERRVSFL